MSLSRLYVPVVIVIASVSLLVAVSPRSLRRRWQKLIDRDVVELRHRDDVRVARPADAHKLEIALLASIYGAQENRRLDLMPSLLLLLVVCCAAIWHERRRRRRRRRRL